MSKIKKEYKSVEYVAIDVLCGRDHRLVKGKLIEHVNDGMILEYKWFGKMQSLIVPEDIYLNCDDYIEGYRLFGVSEGKGVAHPLGVYEDSRINFSVGEVSQVMQSRNAIELQKSTKATSASEILKVIIITAVIALVIFIVYTNMNSSNETVTTATTESIRVISSIIGG